MKEVRPGPDHRFPRLPMPFTGQVALGNGTQWLFNLDAYRQALFVSILQTSYRWGDTMRLLDGGRAITPKMLMRAFAGMLPGDAGNIADLLNDQRRVTPGRHGYYLSNLLERPW